MAIAESSFAKPQLSNGTVRLAIERWSAWAPSLTSKEQWQQWAADPQLPTGDDVPALPFLPGSLRRRCSAAAKLMLWPSCAVLQDDTAEQLPTVFATQGAESQTTLELLEQIAHNEISSPMRFSLSVHNASAGLLSMALKNRAPSTSLSAGTETFACGILESICQLVGGSTSRLLFVAGDEILPPPLRNNYLPHIYQFGSAFLLSGASASSGLQIAYRATKATQKSTDSEAQSILPQPLMFFAWLFGDEQETELQGSGFSLHIRKEPEFDAARSYCTA